MVKKIVNALHVFICVVLTIQLTGCGTLMYPERRGQRGGRIDAGVAVLDAVGLLFFIIPGVIAFAVDFGNGAIYLPGTSNSSLDTKDIKQVRFDPRRASVAGIEKIIRKETGYKIKLNQGNVEISKLKSIDDMMARFAEVLPELQNTSVALLEK